jgi:hypothetical protein
MKKNTLFLVISLLAITGFSQNKPNRADFWEAIRTKRIAVFTQTIGLTPSEAQQFWPVYNAFDKERIGLMRKRRALDESLEHKNGASEADYRKIATDYVGTHMDEARLMQVYNEKYLKILPAEKVCKLYQAERKFREYLMQEFRKNQEERNK